MVEKIKIYSVEPSVCLHHECLMLVSAISEEDAIEKVSNKTDIEDSIGDFSVREIKGVKLADNVNTFMQIFADEISYKDN